MPEIANMIIRLLLAACLGGAIGFEREKKGHSAGLRTHILVSMGSSLVMLLSLYLFQAHTVEGKGSFDAARIAAGVLTGIGFLGAGTIIKSEEGARGLTTAASIWVCAGIGLTVGAGYYSAAFTATLICLFVLYFMNKWEHR